MSTINYSTLMKCLAEVPDPRNERGRRYEWLYLLGVIVAAMMSGQRSIRGMAQWAMGNRVELIRCLSPRRLVVPSAATLYRVLRNVSVERLEVCISAYTQAIDGEGAMSGTVVTSDGEPLRGQAVDGKTVCGASAHGESVHLVSLVRHESGSVLAQVKVAAKRDEREAASRLLQSRSLAGTVTTFDALHTQVKAAEEVLKHRGHYIMEVKKNQPLLYEAINLAFQAYPPINQEEAAFWAFGHFEYDDKQHGRQEWYRLESTSALNRQLNWPGVGLVLRRICSRRNLKTSKFTNEVHFAVSSLTHELVSLAQIEQLWRWHWTIENRVHYPRDVSMGEDACQLHTGSAPQALAALRNAILSLLHHEGWHYLPDAFRFYAANLQHALHTIGIDST